MVAIPDPYVQPTMTVPEAGKILGLRESASYKAARRGEIPVIRVGRRLVVPTAKFLALLEIPRAVTEHSNNTPETAAVTYEQAIDAAAQILADVRAHLATLTPEQAADEAYVPGGPSREQLAAKVRRLCAETRKSGDRHVPRLDEDDG